MEANAASIPLYKLSACHIQTAVFKCNWEGGIGIVDSITELKKNKLKGLKIASIVSVCLHSLRVKNAMGRKAIKRKEREKEKEEFFPLQRGAGSFWGINNEAKCFEFFK